jgi:5-methylthioadenosine/S-adenosylhomocysteine deaminase
MTIGNERPLPRVEVDLLLANGVVITMDAERRILADGAVAVARDRIVGVGRSGDLQQRFSPRRRIDMAGGVLQPGFIDCHVHLSQHLGRGSIPDTWPESREHDHWLPYWLNMTEQDAYLSALLACLEMVNNGTTTFCDMGGRFDAEISAKAARDVGMRGFVSETSWDLPPYPSVSVGDTDACVARLDGLAQRFPADPDNLLWAGLGLAGMGQCSDDLLQMAKAVAAKHGTVLLLHQSFGDVDVAKYEQVNGGVLAVEHLDRLGLLDANTALVHMNRVQESEFELVRLRGTSVIHCPSASTRVGMSSSVVGRFPEMVQVGINVALGSDSGNYSDFLDIGREAYLDGNIEWSVRPGCRSSRRLHRGRQEG